MTLPEGATCISVFWMKEKKVDIHKNRRQDILKKKNVYLLTAVFPGLIVFLLLLSARLVQANSTAQTLPFSQDWSNASLITVNDDWSGVPGIEGFRGDNLASAGADPQTVLAADSPGVPDVNINQTNPNTFATGGVSEFAITNPTVALQGSGTADAPYILIHLDTTGQSGIQVNYNVRDIDGAADNAVQQVALHYRVGNAGSFTNVPAAYIADATTGPSLATLVTAVSVTLPSAVDNQSLVQLRIMTADAAGSDEWVGIDDISISASGADAAPSVSSTSPIANATNVAVNANITINFSEDVNVSGNWYGISCTSSGAHSVAVTGGPTSYTLNPTVDFDNSETCTVTITGTLVTDTDSNDPPDTMSGNYMWSFDTVAPPAPGISIHDIQGASHISPYVGQSVTISPSIVTAIRSNGYYIQEPNPDSDDATSEGMFVFTNSAPTGIAVGDNVSVSGTVVEFRAGGSGSTSLTITEISSPTAIVNSSGNPLPAATVIGTGGRVPPTAVIDDDATGDVELSGTFDETTDGIDFYESLESMYVQINDAVATGPTNSFGEISVLGDSGANATLLTPSGGIIIQPGDFNPERIILDDIIATSEPAVSVGDSFNAPLVGVLDYSFNNFKFLPTSWPAVTSAGLTREIAEAADPLELAVASFNVENLDANDPASKFDDLADLIVNHLQSPDIIAVEEIQDNNGAISNTVVAANLTFETLIEAIEDAGGPTYDYRQMDPVNGADGGEPGGNIRVGFLFRTDRGVAFVDRPGAGSTTANSVVGSGSGTQLQYSPGRIDPTNSAFTTSRKPLAGEFTYLGQTFFVIANHFNSKGGDQPLFGRYQPPTLSSEVQRIQQAQVVNDFVDALLAANPAANIVVLGDINDFWFSNPMATLTAGGVLTPLITTLPANERYGYVFDGNSQDLDHILVSPNLYHNVPFVYDSVHVNAEFVDQISDHDPQLVLLDFAPNLISFTAHGYTTITLNYTGDVPFTTDIYVSFDGVSQDMLLDTVTITDPDGSQDFTLGTTIDLIDTAVEEADVDYYLLADASGSTTLFEGVYQRAGHPIFVHGTNVADTISAAGSSILTVTITYNGNPTTYTNPSTLRIRAHDGDDNVNLSALTFIKGSFEPFVMGGSGNDTLTGGSNDDTFVGGPGNDLINGGLSADTTSYAESPALVTVNLLAGTASDGYGGTDTLVSVNNATGSAYNDNITGNTSKNILAGLGGNDTLDGGSGDDTFIGGAGTDQLIGGNGSDTASYATSPGSVTASLAGGGATADGFGTTDTYTSIENLTGSAFPDNLTGDGSDNTLSGGKGNDTLIGGAGADRLQGQGNNDTMYGNAIGSCADGAIDTFAGGDGTDTGYYNVPDNDVVLSNTEVLNACS
jgi:predicted extracellular nuclease